MLTLIFFFQRTATALPGSEAIGLPFPLNVRQKKGRSAKEEGERAEVRSERKETSDGQFFHIFMFSFYFLLFVFFFFFCLLFEFVLLCFVLFFLFFVLFFCFSFGLFFHFSFFFYIFQSSEQREKMVEQFLL